MGKPRKSLPKAAPVVEVEETPESSTVELPLTPEDILQAKLDVALAELEARPPAAVPSAGPNGENSQSWLKCPFCGNCEQKTVKRRWQKQVSGSLKKRRYFCNKCGNDYEVEIRTQMIAGREYVEVQIVKLVLSD